MKKFKLLIFYLLTISVFLSAFASTVSAASGKNTNAFVYTDSDSGVKFTVPANWKQEAFTEDNDYLTAKFVSTKEDDGVIIFSGTDIWAKLPYFGKNSLSRAEVDNSIFTKADVAEMCNATEDKISLYMYNGIEYYKCTVTANKEVYGTSINVTMTQLLYVNNGWMYIFGFWGDKTHKLYSDFENLIRSVEYPAAQSLDYESSSTPEYSFDSDTNTDDKSLYDQDEDNFDFSINVPLIIVSIIVTVFAYGIFPVVFAKCRSKPITRKKYTLLCYGINVGIMIGFVILNGGVLNVAPYYLWTMVFSRYGIKVLRRKDLIKVNVYTQTPITATVNEQAIEVSDDEVRFCGKCGEKLVENSNFCRKCGAATAREKAATPIQIEPTVASDKIKFCAKCGERTVPNGKFCRRCGAALTIENATTPVQNNPQVENEE